VSAVGDVTEGKRGSSRIGCIIGAIAAMWLIVVVFGGEPDVESSNSSSNMPNALAEAQALNENGSRWAYFGRADEMRNSTTFIASTQSINTANFSFPYEGNQRMTMQLRKSPAFGNDVIFMIERGQILCHTYDCRAAISFDGSTEKLTLNESADNNSAVVFARYPDSIARKIKSSKRVIVEMMFYQEGTRQFTFETEGLEWDHF
jgi:hypothetical protein